VTQLRATLIWGSLLAAIIAPILVAATSPLLQWRTPIYVASGFAGIIALALLLLQPLLAGGYLPGLPARSGRRVHRFIGILLVIMVLAHVGGLWLTSAPDVIDALLFQSPTPFSPWGVIAMGAVFASALLAMLRGPLRVRPKIWRFGHSVFAIIIVIGSIIHAMLVDGTMGDVSKAVLCLLVLAALIKLLVDLRVWIVLKR
jgi:predicted ferric reductase